MTILNVSLISNKPGCMILLDRNRLIRTAMGDADSLVFAEDLVFYAMRKRKHNWHRVYMTLPDDSPGIRRFFTPEIGKTVLQFADQESWSYMDAAHLLIQELNADARFRFGKLIHCLGAVGEDFLNWKKKETLFSYSALIVEVCCYCKEEGYHDSLIEAAIHAAAQCINRRLTFKNEKDVKRYHRFAVEYNKVFAEVFAPQETNLTLELISSIGRNLESTQRDQ